MVTSQLWPLKIFEFCSVFSAQIRTFVGLLRFHFIFRTFMSRSWARPAMTIPLWHSCRKVNFKCNSRISNPSANNHTSSAIIIIVVVGEVCALHRLCCIILHSLITIFIVFHTIPTVHLWFFRPAVKNGQELVNSTGQLPEFVHPLLSVA
jgi:hypothetical protein